MDKQFLINQIQLAISNIDSALHVHSPVNQLKELNELTQYAKGLVTGIGFAGGIEANESNNYHQEISTKYHRLLSTIHAL